MKAARNFVIILLSIFSFTACRAKSDDVSLASGITCQRYVEGYVYDTLDKKCAAFSGNSCTSSGIFETLAACEAGSSEGPSGDVLTDRSEIGKPDVVNPLGHCPRGPSPTFCQCPESYRYVSASGRCRLVTRE